MAGRHNKNGDANRKERGGKKFGQKFYKFFLAAESEERLRIPPSFSQYLLNRPTGLVSLKGQSGNTWLVELGSDTEGLFFGYGWKKFVMDHSIESGHNITFCYNGHSQFSVRVFDGMCIEKPSAFHAKPSKDLVYTTESDEDDKDMSFVPQEENNRTKNSMTSEIDANGFTLRKHSNGALPGYNSDSLNSTEDSDSPYSISEESISRNKTSKSSLMPLKFFKDVDIHGKSILEVQRQPEVRSQRPPVSEEQKNYALQKAKQYKTKYPITLEIMKETHVYRTYFMIIPCEFVREYLPHADKKLTLWDPQGKTWKVTYVYCSQRCAGAFSGGWGMFATGNHLEMFDVCVFELFAKDSIKVHIYRANPALSPYLLDSRALVNKGTI